MFGRKNKISWALIFYLHTINVESCMDFIPIND